MECIPTSYAPFIVQPDEERDWASQHVLSEQLHKADNKQSLIGHTSLQTRKQLPSQLHQQLSTRRSNPLLLQIPKSSSRIQKLITPVKNTKSTKEWESLLRTSMNDLQNVYATMLQVPAAPKAQRPLSGPRPDFSGLDRVQMASRAMQMAAGFNPARREQSVESDTSESSGSEAEMEAPATPVAVENGDMMNIDPRLFS